MPGLVYVWLLVCDLRIGWRPMMRQVCAIFIASLSAAFILASNQAFSASPGGSTPSTHSSGHHGGLHHHNRRNIGTFFPAVGSFLGGPFNAQPNLNLDVRQTITDGIYTCTYDIPWDWVHRCPPFPNPPEPPFYPVVRGPACVPQAVTVPGADGKDQTITVVRC